MKNHRATLMTARFLFLVFLILCGTLLQAQKTDQVINFNTSKVELIFQPPMRSGFNSPHPLQIEVPRLNLVVNLIENYLLYLLRLQKISPESKVTMIYAPEIAVEDWNEESKRIRLKDTGINHVLQQVNQQLREQEGTEKNFLLDSADNLFTIPDQLPRKTSKIAVRTELINHSSFQKSLEPDTDFCIIDENRVVTARPYKRSNRLFIMTDSNGVCSSSMLLDQSNTWYGNLSASADGSFIAFTDGKKPLVMPLDGGEPVPLFPELNDPVLLDMRWSPENTQLAGMILDNKTQERHFFIFDATAGKMVGSSLTGELPANYLNSFPCWSPDGNRLLMTSARDVHLIDLKKKSVQAGILRLPHEIGEIIWSEDGGSFALLEIIGQARDRYLFDDLDYRKTVLHRYRINDDMSIVEDHAQRIESRNTIKLVSFWTSDRVLYLEGRLMSKRLNTPFWDISKSFNAYLTPAPSTSAARDNTVSTAQTSPQLLPMQYLYVFRNLDGKYINTYDAGFSHCNHIFVEAFTNVWFIGLRKPEEFRQESNVFSHRHFPYPFMENNIAVFSDIGSSKMETLLKFLQDYNLRAIDFNSNITRLFMLANFSGPMNLWSGDLPKLVEGLNQTEE